MILDRTWNKREQKLVVSYIDKAGNRQFYQRYLHHIKTYEYDKDGDLETWNGKKCIKIYKNTQEYEPNEFDILEYLYELPKDTLKSFRAQNFPKLYTFDIETEYSTDFPDPEVAAFKVTAISLVGPDLSCIVYGLNRMSESSIELFKQRYLDFIKNNEFASDVVKNQKTEPKVLYQFFDTEEKMLEHWFTVIVPKIACLAGWNSYRFDWQYLTNRAIRVFGRNVAYQMFRKSSPTGELGNISFVELDGTKHRLPAPKHSIVLDYMDICKDYDRVLVPYESFSLDWVAEHAVKANKIKYEHGLQYLYEHDHEWYYYYNAVDSLLVQLIHKKLKCLESPCAVSGVTLVPLLAAFGQVALTTANVFEEVYKDNKKVVYDYDAIERVKIPYEGAFCECVPGRFEYNVCEDFKSLYPMQVQTCNLSFENFIQKTVPNNVKGLPDVKVAWTPQELDEFRKDPNYFVSTEGHVYKNDKDYAFKKMQRRVLKGRDVYKYTGQKIESQLLVEIDRLIKEKEQNLK